MNVMESLEVIKQIDREQHANDMQWLRRIVCVGLDVIPIEEGCDTEISKGRRVAVNYWTEYAFNKEIALQTGPVRRIDPKTGLCTEIVHSQKPVERRTDSDETKDTHNECAFAVLSQRVNTLSPDLDK